MGGGGAQSGTTLRSGRDVLVHCKGGLGRAGTIAARLMVELGTPPGGCNQARAGIAV